MRVEFRVRVLTDEGEKLFGEGPYRLLRGVERLGSLRAAAGELGMAYSKASRIVSRAERLLGAPLTRRRIGGPDGGGSALTPLAQELLARYDALRADCEAAARASFAQNFGDLLAASDAGCSFPEGSTRFSEDSPQAMKSRTQRAGARERAVEMRGEAAEMSLRDSSSPKAGAEGNGECAFQPMPSRSRADSRLVTEAQRQSPGESARAFAAQESPTCASSHRTGEASAALGCVVLAAGRGRRFGGGKLLAELDGRPVLARTLAALPLECFCRAVVVASDPAVSALCRGLGLPVREYPGGALSDSIREGLAEMGGADGCMFVNGDQPLLRPESLRRLTAAFASDPTRVYRLAHDGTAASPVVFPASAYPALRALTGESGGMAALRDGDWEVCAVEAEDASELWDVDDPAALRRAEMRLREGSRR